MSRVLTSVVLVLVFAAVGRADKPRDVSPLLERLVESHRAPGMVAALIRKGEIRAIGAAGVRRLKSADKVTINDRFHLGSCTKAMTATLCAILVEEGKLRWDLTLAQAFPELKGKMSPAWQGVTLEQLLTNRGGVPTDLHADGLWGKLWQHRGTPASARRLLLTGVIAREPEAPPGSKFIYSNGGFAIAGHMAETVMKQPYETLMRQWLFGPLGMTSAGFGPPAGKNPVGHRDDGTPMPAEDNPDAIAPAGKVHCSIGDWAKFISQQLPTSIPRKLLKPETIAKLHEPAGEGLSPPTPPSGRYAMGWSVTERQWGGGRVLNHNGSNTMWFAVVWFAPAKDLAVMACANQDTPEIRRACDEAVSAMIQEELGQ